MKHLIPWPISLLAAALLLVPATLRSHDLPKPILAEMEALNARVSEGFATKNIDLVMSAYANTPNVQAVINGMIFLGPDEIRAATIGALSFPGTIRNEVVSIRYTRVGELVIVVGTERNTFTPADGSPSFTITSVWSDVRKKIDGKWVMILNHVTMLP